MHISARTSGPWFVYVIEYYSNHRLGYYIGSARNVYRRFQTHKRLRNNPMYNSNVQEHDVFHVRAIIRCESKFFAYTIERKMQREYRIEYDEEFEFERTNMQFLVRKYHGEWFV
jgi:predicted GIY-YIG superfamily endonuclease